MDRLRGSLQPELRGDGRLPLFSSLPIHSVYNVRRSIHPRTNWKRTRLLHRADFPADEDSDELLHSELGSGGYNADVVLCSVYVYLDAATAVLAVWCGDV